MGPAFPAPFPLGGKILSLMGDAPLPGSCLFPGFFLELTGNLQKSREKKRRNFSSNFVTSSLAFPLFFRFPRFPPERHLYITFADNFILQRVIHIFHTFFHIRFFLAAQAVSIGFQKNSKPATALFPGLENPYFLDIIQPFPAGSAQAGGAGRSPSRAAKKERTAARSSHRAMSQVA